MKRATLRRASAWVLPLGLVATVAFAAAEAAGCFSYLDDCPSTLGFGPACSGAASGSTGTGSSGSASGSGGTGAGGTSGSSTGTGGKPECTKASDCPGAPPGPCASRGVPECEDGGKCTVAYDAGLAPSQVTGDCNQNVCDTSGNVMKKPDNGDVYDDGDPCDQYTCNGGLLSSVMQMLGAACPMQGGYCIMNPDPTNAGLAVCAQCADDSECTMGVTTCHEGKCVLPHCLDGMQDNGETDKDCGGLDCPPCKVGQHCSFYTDCFSQVCAAVDGGTPTCQKPSCSDGKQNEDETDVDCGGSCPACPMTAKCLLPSDCQSGVCLVPAMGPPARCAAPTCTDGVQNGNESGVDCSGAGGCPPCGDGGP